MLSVFSWLWSVIKAGFVWLWDQAYGFLVWLFESVGVVLWEWIGEAREFAIATVSGWIDGLLADVAPPFVVDGLQSMVWIFPLVETLALVVATYSTVATVRIVRWAIGLIPGVNG